MKVEYGVRSKPVETEVVALWWSRFALDYNDSIHKNLEHLKTRLKADNETSGSGVYAFIGAHDAVPTPHLLYIGVAHKQPLRDEICASMFPTIGYKAGTELYFFEDTWDVTIQWAPIPDGSLARLVETLLIVSHSPQFNAQKVRRADIPDQASHLLVLNGGRKGRLQPAVAGHTFSYWI